MPPLAAGAGPRRAYAALRAAPVTRDTLPDTLDTLDTLPVTLDTLRESAVVVEKRAS